MNATEAVNDRITSRRDPRFEVVLYKHVGEDGAWTLDYYLKHGGYEAARKALTGMTPEAVVDEVKASGLRGRGVAFYQGVNGPLGFVPREILGSLGSLGDFGNEFLHAHHDVL